MAIVNIVSRWNSSQVLFTTTVPDSVEPSRRMATALELAVSRGMTLREADLSYCNLSYASLCSAKLPGAIFTGTSLRYAKLRQADLRSSVFRHSLVTYAELDRADLTNADFLSTNLGGSTLRKATLEGTNFGNTNLKQVNFAGSVFRKVALGDLGAIAQATRSDDHSFQLIDCADGKWRVMAGCRWFTLPAAWRHWSKTRRNTDLGEETYDILVMFEHQAERRAKARK
jgi:uncharacterized protein YjbI with pentapeptide repeats